MKRQISSVFSSLLVFVISMEASAVIEADAFETLSTVHPIKSQIVDNRITSAPLRLAGKTKTVNKVKEKTKTRTVDEDGNITKTKVKTKTKTTTTSSSDNSDDNSNQSDSSGGYIGASYEGE
ncbi:MAG: hypothetical protein ABW152_17540 [Candidatus Thiodiazotropha endolucinida]